MPVGTVRHDLISTELILLGAIPAALLALVVDGSTQALTWGLRGGGIKQKRTGFQVIRAVLEEAGNSSVDGQSR